MAKKTMEKRAYNYGNFYERMLLESHCSMFEYSNLPVTINPYFLENFLQTAGSVAIFDTEGGIICAQAVTTPPLDVYGVGINVIATTRNGKEYRLTNGIDCIVAYNNLTMSPCADIFLDAQTLADIQTSIDFLIFWTRLSPLVRVSDEKTKNMVVNAFQSLKKGIPVTIASKRLLAEYGIPDDFSIENLTQPDFADKIQYTAKLYDDVLRWHYTRYGHAQAGNSKTAQQTVDEVDSTVSQSMILPLSMLKAREKAITALNGLFGTNASVRLSGSWRAEVTAYEKQTGEKNIDNVSGGENNESV